MKRLILASLIVFLFAATAHAGDRLIEELSWARLAEAGILSADQVQPGGPAGQGEHVLIDNAADEATTVTIAVIDRPDITALRYALVGQVKCDGVQGAGYLEMLSAFSDGSVQFTRTMSEHGPMQALTGTSDWRPFFLPFQLQEGGDGPERLTLNVVFAGSGAVQLAAVKLIDDPGDAAGYAPGQWWGSRTGGWLGAIVGCLIGCIGAATGILSSVGTARRFVLTVVNATILLGLCMLVLCGIALISSQPYVVWYPLALVGGLDALIFTALRGTIRKRYEQVELRKIAAADVD